MKESNEVTNANKDIKKLNASIAIVYLQWMDEQGLIIKKDKLNIVSVCSRLVNTPLYKPDGGNDQEDIQHAIKLIEEYLEEEGV